MNNIVANFDQIVEFAKEYGLPLSKRRAILREYLQIKVLDFIYQHKISSYVIFVGGTCLRLVRNLDRFSEDLDFDLVDVPLTRIDQLVDAASARLKKENIEHDLYRNKTSKRLYFELRFKNLLYELGISRNKSEKLSIKFDFESLWQRHNKEVVLVNRYGFLINIVTLPINQHLIQKLVAYTGRVKTQPRDIYDISWLIAQGAKPDWKFAKENGFSENLMLLAKKKFKEETRKLPGLKARLKPYLLSESYVTKLDLFPQLLERTGNI